MPSESACKKRHHFTWIGSHGPNNKEAVAALSITLAFRHFDTNNNNDESSTTATTMDNKPPHLSQGDYMENSIGRLYSILSNNGNNSYPNNSNHRRASLDAIASAKPSHTAPFPHSSNDVLLNLDDLNKNNGESKNDDSLTISILEAKSHRANIVI